MDNVYELIYNDAVTQGGFFKDEDFGVYFFTDVVPEEIYVKKECNLKITDQMVIASIDKNNDYVIHKIERSNGFVYAFALKDGHKAPSASYLTLEDLALGSDFKLFTGGEVLEYLANIVELPNGNFVVGRVEDYITSIEKVVKKHPDKEAFFRGHYYYKYLLIPSLYRKKKFYDNEANMYMDFKTQYYNELSGKKYIEILTTMQHYKMPTRLLDTTSNPLVALYMACDKPSNYKNKNFGIGEVVVMNEERKNVKYSDSNVITLLSSLAVLETDYKLELYNVIKESLAKNDPSIYKQSIAFKRFVAEVQHELPYFDETFFNPEVLLTPRHVKVGMINERIIAQSGNFILFGLCDYETGEYRPLKTVTKERIFVVHREYIQKQLALLNINNGTMYPDKDHMSVTIVKSYD